MTNYRSVGWDMYDPRTTIKATVLASETIYLGDACRIDSDGYITNDLNATDRIHGLALTGAVGGDELVLVTHGRLKVVDTQTNVGDLVMGGTEVNGSSPNTEAGGQACGWAISAKLLFIHVDNVSAYDLGE